MAKQTGKSHADSIWHSSFAISSNLAKQVIADMGETGRAPDTIAADVPAAVVWNFRLASLGQLAVLWAGLGLVSGWLLDRLVRSLGR